MLRVIRDVVTAVTTAGFMKCSRWPSTVPAMRVWCPQCFAPGHGGHQQGGLSLQYRPLRRPHCSPPRAFHTVSESRDGGGTSCPRCLLNDSAKMITSPSKMILRMRNRGCGSLAALLHTYASFPSLWDVVCVVRETAWW